jgi:hypothetical protein
MTLTNGFLSWNRPSACTRVRLPRCRPGSRIGPMGHMAPGWQLRQQVALGTSPEHERAQQDRALAARAAGLPALPFRFRMRARDFCDFFRCVLLYLFFECVLRQLHLTYR